MAITPSSYKPIADYGAIGNLRSVALVGLDGSVDWLCFPQMDSPAVFSAILDHQRGGRFRVAPVGMGYGEQRYLPGTNVLETWFDTGNGRLTVTDLMPLGGTLESETESNAPPELIRIIACEGGSVDVDVEWAPRLDYARSEVHIEPAGHGFVATETTGDGRLILGGLPEDASVIDEGTGPAVRARWQMEHGEEVVLTTAWNTETARSDQGYAWTMLNETVEAWRSWLYKAETSGAREWASPVHDHVVRSELALKLMVHAGSGAVAAAATTSLPETIGGVRNWDYRYSWIRDAGLVVQALSALGHKAEGVDFLHWAERVSEAHTDEAPWPQIMYTLDGAANLDERELGHLDGYRGSRPVRTGNGASTQKQLDIFGELLSSAYELVRQDVMLEDEIWTFLSTLTDRICEVWKQPDDGIWEQRNGPRHYVYSKVMAWVALDRAIHLASESHLRGNVARWKQSRAEVFQAVLEHGVDPESGMFIQAFDRPDPDASNLLIPLQEFLPFDDPRVQATIDATLHHLTENGLVYRYRNDDGLPGEEGAFGLTTFWLVDALALSGRMDEAHEVFDGIVQRANHVGLYSEQMHPETGEFLGNFPQAFSHIGLINSALYLAYGEGREVPGPSLIGTPEHRQVLGHPVSVG